MDKISNYLLRASRHYFAMFYSLKGDLSKRSSIEMKYDHAGIRITLNHISFE
jgi:hypothetical protein